MNINSKDAFLMPIQSIMSIAGKGTIVNGRIIRGTVNKSDIIQIIGIDNETITTKVTGIEKMGKQSDTAEAGEFVDIILADIAKERIKVGKVLAKPNTIVATRKFEAEFYMLRKEEGGRNAPLLNNSKLQFHFRDPDVTGVIILQHGVDLIIPGDTTIFTAELELPVAMEKGTRFSIRENNKLIGTGIIKKIY